MNISKLPAMRSTEVGYFVIGLFDLLGQSQALEKYGPVPRTQAEMEIFKEHLNATVGEIDGFRETFKSFFQRFLEQLLQGPETIPLTDQLKAFLKRLHTVDLRLMVFSDTVVTFAPLRIDEGQFTALGLYSMMTASINTIIFELARHIPIRGSIEVGIGGEFWEGQVYGPALARANHIEKEVCQWPRIVIGPGALKFLSDCASDDSRSVRSEYNKIVARICLDLIQKDKEGVSFLDYLGERCRGYVGHDPQIREAVLLARDFVETELKRFTKEGNDKLAARYFILDRYFQDNVQRWTKA